MMGEPAGWYRDPAPPNPGAPSTLRWWDGQQWTAQVKQASKRERQAWQAEAAAQQREWAVQQAQQLQGTGHAGGGGAPGLMLLEASRDVTPDGERLAGWWQRVGASVIDGIITGVLGIAFGWRFLQQLMDVFSRAVDDAVQAGRSGTVAQTDTVLAQLTGPLIGLVAVMWGVRLAYQIGFLKGFAATPGKLALGLEVRLRERPGPLAWGTVLVRVLMANVGSLLSVVPVAALVAWVYPLLDVLWPLWDPHRQALHDKVARTNVVRRR